jgi:hypothetical protein
VALGGTLPNHTEPTIGGSPNTDPYRAFAILEKLGDHPVPQLRGAREPAPAPTTEPFQRADPESPIARGKQAGDEVGGELLILGRLPGDGPDAIETKEAELRAQPKVAVRRLSDRGDRSLGKTLPDLPRRVRVLADVQRRIEREQARTPRQEGHHGDKGSPYSPRCPHDAPHPQAIGYHDPSLLCKPGLTSGLHQLMLSAQTRLGAPRERR